MPHRRTMTTPPNHLSMSAPRTYSNWETFRSVFFQGDTSTIRAVLMVASVWESLSFAIRPDVMLKAFYADMRFFPALVWGFLFLLHAALVWWRFRDPVNRDAVGYAVNGYGFFLWAFVTFLESYSVWKGSPALSQFAWLAPSVGMEWTVVAASFGALCRTGDKGDRASA